MAILLKGAPVAKEICEEAARRAEKLRERGIAPALAIVRVGENDADIYYERAAMRRCDAVGIDVRNVILRESVTQQELICAIRELNEEACLVMATKKGVIKRTPMKAFSARCPIFAFVIPS